MPSKRIPCTKPSIWRNRRPATPSPNPCWAIQMLENRLECFRSFAHHISLIDREIAIPAFRSPPKSIQSVWVKSWCDSILAWSIRCSNTIRLSQSLRWSQQSNLYRKFCEKFRSTSRSDWKNMRENRETAFFCCWFGNSSIGRLTYKYDFEIANTSRQMNAQQIFDLWC